MTLTHTRSRNRAALVRLIGVAALFLPVLSYAQVPTYTITTIAGTGSPGKSDNGTAVATAQLNGPTSVAIDSKGNLYIADQFNNLVRAIIDGKIQTIAGNGVPGLTGDLGKATDAGINSPDTVLVDSSGIVYFSDTMNSVVRKIDTAGIINTVAGSTLSGGGFSGDGADATKAQINKPSGIVRAANGDLYIADTLNFGIRKVTAADGFISHLAGNGFSGFCCDGPALQAHFWGTRQLALAPNGDLYLADSFNNQIRKISGGVVTLVAGDALAAAGFSGDGGLAIGAKLNHPAGVAVDSANNIYIADTFNNRIRMITRDGIITTIAGTAKPGYSGDTGPALGAQFYNPNSLIVDANGILYVADTSNHVIRKLVPNTGPGSGGTLPAIRDTNGAISAGDFGALSTIAPGSWIEIYGTNLATTTRTWAASDFVGVRAPTSLNRTTVSVGGQAAFIDYISPTQINAQVPSGIGLGTLSVVVGTATGASTAFNITAKLQSPGLYAPPAYKIAGKQYVGALFTDFKTYAFPTSAFSGIPSRPAKPGDVIVLYGIGFGQVPGTLAGQIAESTNNLTLAIQPKFYFDGVQAQVQYAGLVAGSVGLYQFNVIVPPIADNDAAKLTFTVNYSGADTPGEQTLYTAVKK